MPKINKLFAPQAYLILSNQQCDVGQQVQVYTCLEVSTNLIGSAWPQLKAKLTGASVVSFWIPHAKVSHGAGGEAHTYLTDVIALQEDEELGFTFNAAVILRASVTAFGAR